MISLEKDFNVLKLEVKQFAVKYLGTNTSQLSEKELDLEINKNKNIKEKINKFFNAYEALIDFHKGIEGMGKWGNLSENEIVRLGNLMDFREKSRTDLIILLNDKKS